MQYSVKQVFFLMALVSLFSTFSLALSPLEVRAKTATEQFVSIDFDNADITMFIKYISELTGKNFVIDKAVKGTVTIMSPTKISAAEAYKVFESVLEVQGYTTVPAGKIIKIVPAVNARSKSVATGLLSSNILSGDKVVTQLIPLQYADSMQLKRLLAPLVSKTSVIISYPPTGMLIVTDVFSNIKRLLSIIKEIDVPGTAGMDITVLPLQNASAPELAQTLTEIFANNGLLGGATQGKTKKSGSTPRTKIIADERTNVLVVLASDTYIKQVKKLVTLLDVQNPQGGGDIHVYYLQNANAEDLAKVLTSLPSKGPSDKDQGKLPVLSNDIQVVADKATNSLVITAKRDEYAILEGVIKKLDIQRSMVYLEALIMEVNVDNAFTLGVEWAGGASFNGGDGALFAGSGAGPLSGNSVFELAAGNAPSARGLSFGVMGNTITIGDTVFPTIGAVVNAYKSDANIHIISTPQILTTDNQEAEIKVGENVPYITSKNTTNVTLQDYTNYEYKDVGVTLRITPHINHENIVRLDIFTEVIKLKNPEALSETPSTLKRTASTTVIVGDSNTIVIGGIIGDDVNSSTYKLPILGDIPVLGWLFKSHSVSRERRNLYIFITPRIVRTPSDASLIYQEKREDANKHQKSGFGDDDWELDFQDTLESSK